MNEKRSKILGTAIFLLLISLIIFLVFSPIKKIDSKIKSIELSGNNLLSEADYLAFAKLDDLNVNQNISLSIVKDRLEKHPYIERADVEFRRANEVNVILKEKTIAAMLLSRSEQFFLSDKFQVLCLCPNTKFVDYPIISNLAEENEIKMLSFLKSKDAVEAFKIIDALKNSDERILNRLSEINMQKGGDIILTFSGIKSEVRYGRGDAAKKMVFIETLFNSGIENQEVLMSYDYIDLRFSSGLYVGKYERTGLL
jgi:cell division septal protein FtsQ